MVTNDKSEMSEEVLQNPKEVNFDTYFNRKFSRLHFNKTSGWAVHPY